MLHCEFAQQFFIETIFLWESDSQFFQPATLLLLLLLLQVRQTDKNGHMAILY
jgi:hypothetical protein